MDSKYLVHLLFVFIFLTTNRCSARKNYRPVKKDPWRFRKFPGIRRGIPARCSDIYTRRCSCYYYGGHCFRYCQSRKVNRLCAVG